MSSLNQPHKAPSSRPYPYLLILIPSPRCDQAGHDLLLNANSSGVLYEPNTGRRWGRAERELIGPGKQAGEYPTVHVAGTIIFCDGTFFTQFSQSDIDVFIGSLAILPSSFRNTPEGKLPLMYVVVPGCCTQYPHPVTSQVPALRSAD